MRMEVEKPIQQCAIELNQAVNYLHGVIAIDQEQSSEYLEFVYETADNPVLLTERREQAARSIGKLYIASLNIRERTYEKYPFHEQVAISLLTGRSSIDPPLSLSQMTKISYDDKTITTQRFQHSLRVTSNALIRLQSRVEANPARMIEAYNYTISPKPPKGVA
jgi:hypothetical protein